MYKYNKFYGVDISKDVFDVMNSKGEHFQLRNDETGFKKLVKAIDKGSLVVMEATGYYQLLFSTIPL